MVSIEGGEHLADGWDPDLLLVKYVLFFSKKDAVCNGCVGVFVWVMVQTDHIAFGDKVEEDRCEEGEEANDSTESNLHPEAMDSYPSIKQNVGHDEEAGPAGAIREQLYT